MYVGLMRSEQTENLLKEIGVPYRLYPDRIVSLKQDPLLRIWQKVGARLLPYIKRGWFWRILRKNHVDLEQDVIWSIEMQGAAILGDRALRFGRRHVQTFYELGDRVGVKYFGFDVHAMCESATLVECEYNRAHIFKAEHGLKRLPFIVPNKPYEHPRERGVKIEDPRASQEVEKWADRKVVLYQGGIQDDRGELLQVVEALCRNFPQLTVAVMGKETPAVCRLRSQFKNFSYVPFVQPPEHLEVTSHASIGLAFYKGGVSYGLSPLNPVYCAPNKIYEYAGFGIPILCNDIPGLRYSVGTYDAGICLDDLSEEQIVRAMNRLLAEYDRFSAGALRMYDAVSLKDRIGEILEFARGAVA